MMMMMMMMMMVMMMMMMMMMMGRNKKQKQKPKMIPCSSFTCAHGCSKCVSRNYIHPHSAPRTGPSQGRASCAQRVGRLLLRTAVTAYDFNLRSVAEYIWFVKLVGSIILAESLVQQTSLILPLESIGPLPKPRQESPVSLSSCGSIAV